MSDREKIDLAVGEVLVEVSNYPSGARSALWGQDIGLLQDKVTEAVLAVLPKIKAQAVREAGDWIAGTDLGGYEYVAERWLTDRAADIERGE